MKKIKIGSSDIKASLIGLGTWAIGGGEWWGESEEELSIKTIQAAIDSGINLIDTAPGYGFGKSEEIVGRAIKNRRSEVIISTKCGLWWQDSRGSEFFKHENQTVNRSLEPDTIKAEIELSLKRLNTDYIDVYFTHWQSMEPHFTPIKETMDCLMDLKRQGVIKAIGASNVTRENICEYTKYGELDVIQEKYSMLDRRIEQELIPECISSDLSIFAYSPIEQGLLTGKIGRDYVVNPKEARASNPWMAKDRRELVISMLESWQELTAKYNCTLTQLVLAWTHSQAVTHILCGARKPSHITEATFSAEIELNEEDIKRMKNDVLNLERK